VKGLGKQLLIGTGMWLLFFVLYYVIVEFLLPEDRKYNFPYVKVFLIIILINLLFYPAALQYFNTKVFSSDFVTPWCNIFTDLPALLIILCTYIAIGPFSFFFTFPYISALITSIGF
jgi:hypothetical protein